MSITERFYANNRRFIDSIIKPSFRGSFLATTAEHKVVIPKTSSGLFHLLYLVEILLTEISQAAGNLNIKYLFDFDSQNSPSLRLQDETWGSDGEGYTSYLSSEKLKQFLLRILPDIFYSNITEVMALAFFVHKERAKIVFIFDIPLGFRLVISVYFFFIIRTEPVPIINLNTNSTDLRFRPVSYTANPSVQISVIESPLGKKEREINKSQDKFFVKASHVGLIPSEATLCSSDKFNSKKFSLVFSQEECSQLAFDKSYLENFSKEIFFGNNPGPLFSSSSFSLFPTEQLFYYVPASTVNSGLKKYQHSSGNNFVYGYTECVSFKAFRRNEHGEETSFLVFDVLDKLVVPEFSSIISPQ